MKDIAGALILTLALGLEVQAMELSPSTTVATLPNGVRTRIGTAFALDNSCSEQGKIVVRVLKEAQLGVFEVVEAEGATSYDKNDQRSKCNSEKHTITQFYYTSRDGVVGKDNILVHVFYPNGNSRKRTFAVSVQ